MAAESRDQSLTRLVETYQHDLRRMCCMVLRDSTSAEDAVQETFLKAYRNLEKFRGECSEKAWLMAIAVNTCRDMTRAAWFRHTERRVTPEELPIAAPNPSNEDGMALAQAIRALPCRLRDVILLYYYQDLTVQEVAHVLGAAPSTVTKRLRQAREKLRAELERGDA